LTVLDRDPRSIEQERVVYDPRIEAVSAPDSVVAADDTILHEEVTAERRFDSVRRRVAEVILVDDVVVRSPLPRVHRRLAGPEKQPVARVRERVERDHVPAALFVDENPRRVLATMVKAFAVTTNVVVDAVVHDAIVARAVETHAEPRIEREVVVP